MRIELKQIGIYIYIYIYIFFFFFFFFFFLKNNNKIITHYSEFTPIKFIKRYSLFQIKYSY